MKNKMSIELKAFEFVVNKTGTKKEFPLRGLNFPLESGLNGKKSILNYASITNEYIELYIKATSHWRNE
jgi:hypothetical protein